jgi:hypothetical protein
MNSVYREFFPADPHARTVCGVKLIGGHKLWAARPRRGESGVPEELHPRMPRRA